MSTNPASRTNLLAGVVAIVVMAIAFFAFSATSGDDVVATDQKTIDTVDIADAPVGDQTADSSATEPAEAAEAIRQFSDLPTISIDELPIEAIDTLVLIDEGGPYPYRQDDGTFQNREGILPDRSSEHYREYTVDTPGSPDRGARRIVSGADGERYYTDDHYDSFREVVG